MAYWRQNRGVQDEAIPILRVADVITAAAWYSRLGYETEWEHRFAPSLPAFICVARAGAARLFLSEHKGDARAGTVVYLRVADVDSVAREFQAMVVDQPWGREVHLTDPYGNRLRVGTPANLD